VIIVQTKIKKIGFIGLGHMGNPMVNNLLKNDYHVTVFDVNKTAQKAMVSLGAHDAKTLEEIAKYADVVITMLQTGDQVKQCCFGDQGVFAHLKSDALFIDCSSIDIQTSRELHAVAKSKKITMCDAPVSGGVLAANNAAITFMVGCDENAFDTAKTILNAMGKKIIYAGLAGSGVAAKICNNMLLGISMIGVCEAFALAEKLELDPKKLFEIASNASGQCWSLTQYCPWPTILPNVPSSHDYKPGFTANMMLKDLRLSQDAAASVHAQTPLGHHAMQLYEDFVNANDHEIDFSAIIQLLQKKQKKN
jgi:3-hydroxyisobutyrate dehydrogenase